MVRRIISINKTECEMLGYAREEVLGRQVFDFVAPEFREQAHSAFPEKIRGDQPLRTIERTLQTREGRRLFVRLDPNSAPAHIFRVRHRARTEHDFDYFL